MYKTRNCPTQPPLREHPYVTILFIIPYLPKAFLPQECLIHPHHLCSLHAHQRIGVGDLSFYSSIFHCDTSDQRLLPIPQDIIYLILEVFVGMPQRGIFAVPSRTREPSLLGMPDHSLVRSLASSAGSVPSRRP